MDTSNKDIHMNTTKMYIDEFGTKRYKNSKGEPHRLDGPAVECLNGNKFWYKEGKRHREKGPAIEWADGVKYWYKDGKLHKIDGPAKDFPAKDFPCGNKYWYILNKILEEKDFNSWLNRIQKFI